MKKNYKKPIKIISIFIFIISSFVVSFFVFADLYGPISPGAFQEIDWTGSGGDCKKVTNNTSNTHFFPAGTLSDWNTNKANHASACPGCFNLDDCAPTSHAYFDCYANDVWWYNSDNVREFPKKEECGSDSCGAKGPYYCGIDPYDGRLGSSAVWYDQVCVDRGCSGNSCFADTTTSHLDIRCKIDDNKHCESGSCVCDDGYYSPASGFPCQLITVPPMTSSMISTNPTWWTVNNPGSGNYANVSVTFSVPSAITCTWCGESTPCNGTKVFRSYGIYTYKTCELTATNSAGTTVKRGRSTCSCASNSNASNCTFQGLTTSTGHGSTLNCSPPTYICTNNYCSGTYNRVLTSNTTSGQTGDGTCLGSWWADTDNAWASNCSTGWE